ncbi:peptidoglycan-binding domain-containing protein [Litorisediminicola beolgyonensis]|uniref:Peptidoglycan-binding domain-containing protein n=1 Tax=Litorisediminicola beolgyonensis TaxID=1173614 RepID=A0ABW3ZEK1_9RHOB
MIRPPFRAAALLALTAACAETGPAPEDAEPPPPLETAADGRCYATEITPAVYEQVPGQVQVVQAELAADGTVIRPPIYRNATVPRVVRPRGETRFEAPCPAEITPEFLATLQRALAARGLYRGPVTGTLDAATRDAIRAYQSTRGLDSAQLSLESARALGLVISPLSEG